MTKGVLLMALGHINYKRMAYNLAASLKSSDPELPVAIATDLPIDIQYSHLFSEQIIIPEKVYVKGDRKEYIRAKLFMYDLSPFEETLFLDVDQIMIPGRTISPIFDELKDVDLTMSNTGIAGVSVWADINEVKRIYGDKPYWNFHSELVYFKKCDKAKSFFKAAKKAYSDNKVKSAHRFAHAAMADELAFQIAAMVTGIYPHKENWTPNYWWGRQQKMNGKFPYQLTGFTTYSIGGNQIPAFVKTNYNNLAAYWFTKMKLQNPYKVADKKAFIPERKKF